MSAYCIQGTERALLKGIGVVKGALETPWERININKLVRVRCFMF